ncbi:MAG: DUF1631 domain-containing protein, partial [Polaromonas sp.]|nr:DUF1631 domain-containing protein [Polaromonas sp.]
MSLHAQLLQSCVEEAAAASRAALGRVIDDALAALQIAESQSTRSAERNALASACLGLMQRRLAWLKQYPADLLAAFEQGVQTSTGAALQVEAAGAGGPVSAPAALQPGAGRSSAPGTLSLIGDAEISQTIEASRLLQRVLPAVEVPLAELDRLISAAQALDNVRPELNPLRPEIFTLTLRALVADSTPDREMAGLWLSHLAAPLGRELRLIYEKAVNRLELGQVRAVGYRVLPAAAATGRRRGGSLNVSTGRAVQHDAGRGAGGPSNRAGRAASSGDAANGEREPSGYVSDEPLRPSGFTDLSDPGVQTALMNDFLRGDAQEVANHRLAPAYYDDIEEELKALKRERDPPPEPVPTGPTDAGAGAGAESQTPED